VNSSLGTRHLKQFNTCRIRLFEYGKTTYLQYKMHFKNAVFEVSTQITMRPRQIRNEIEDKIFITKSSKKIIM